MTPFPKISIVTPSYNQGQFIEETMLSVLDQDYPNIEYIVIDGGSTDNTVEVLRKHAHRLSWWVSEKDKGQPHAINKGLSRCTGDIIAFINSDDYYAPGAFRTVAEAYSRGHEWIAGAVRNFHQADKCEYLVTQRCNGKLYDWLVRNNENHQPGNFWSRRVLDETGLMDENLHYSFDWEYWLRMVTKGFSPFVINEETLANFRLHEESKTVKYWRNFNREYVQLMEDYKKFLGREEAALVDKEIIRLQVKEKIHFARIESINGKFKEAYGNFREAIRIKPSLIIQPRFFFEFVKAMVYMPLRKKAR